MRIVVIGAGIVGAATALALQEAGHEVVVVERESQAAMGTSYANGGQLSFGHAEPWANPSVFAQLPRWLFSNSSPIGFHGYTSREAMAWAWKFLRASMPSVNAHYASELLALAMQSQAQYQQWHQHYGWEEMQLHVGTLHLAKSPYALHKMIEQAGFQAARGCRYDVLHTRDVVLKESSLAYRKQVLSGSVIFPDDGCGDAHLVAKAMLREARKQGAIVCFEESFKGVEPLKGRLSVATSCRSILADRVVVCAGVDVADWSERLGIALPLISLQGYSLTYDISDDMEPYIPHHAVTDTSAKMVMSRLGKTLRVAGFGDIGRGDERFVAARQRQLHHYAAQWFPALQEANISQRWVGQRPAVPHAVPSCMETAVKGVWVNVGHGSLGWTLAAGSAAQMVQALGMHEYQAQKSDIMM